ncbi:CvpA family protein [Petrocella sp. FN5]|uniref:CvpA family protein n=1 Tax=Petrocella sp. FN5 TaxID=3032002 RepID=UPI0023DC24FC|nr:CvpA family protein [Petrocella sp. FN5]MDF1618360.1 CvpA family protein [Petrocella sp. FN5]
MNTLDIILIAIILFCAINGMIKGFVKTLFGLTSTIVALVLTLLISPQVSGLIINNTSFDQMIGEKTVELLNIENLMGDQDAELDEVILSGAINLPGNILRFLEKNNTPEINDKLEAKGLGDYISGSIATMAVNAFVFLIVFLIVSLILNAVVIVLDILTRLPIVKSMNKLGGFSVGLLIGILIVWVATLSLSFIISIQATETLSELIESSIFTKLFYYNNPLHYFIMNLGSALK